LGKEENCPENGGVDPEIKISRCTLIELPLRFLTRAGFFLGLIWGKEENYPENRGVDPEIQIVDAP
jgi:hypothetical protein